jgi:deazaflavin-dependent oxidoreductase (nitroreductase family)
MARRHQLPAFRGPVAGARVARHPLTGAVPAHHAAIGATLAGMSAVVHLVRSILAPLTRTRLFRALGPAALPPLERLMHRISRGRVQLSALLVPTLVLHSAGAKSGLSRESVLMYTPDGYGRAIVAGTSFARERHPAWTYNLLAHPDADILVRGRRLHVRADLLSGDDRERAWGRIEAQWPGYRGYERESGRTVRLFLLRPVSGDATPPGTGAGHGRHAQ